jgi:hypothetical protein
MTLAEPLMAEDTVLLPGTYVWKLVDSPSNRHIVQISDQRTGRVAATILALPRYRTVVSSKNEVQFWETPLGTIKAVRTWFYPGDNYGQEFTYPKRMVPLMSTALPRLTPAPARSVSVVVVPQKRVGVKHRAIARPSTSQFDDQEMAEGSWAVASDKVRTQPKQAISTKHQTGLWDSVKNLPLTATLAPLIGLIGLTCLTIFLLSLNRRKDAGKAIS